MHCRERGAAHVNIFFFLVTLVLFLAAVGFGYVQLTENNEVVATNKQLTAENEQLKVNAVMFNHYVEDLRKVAGDTGTYAGREGFTYEGYDVQPQPLENVTLPSKLRTTLNDYARAANIPESNATPVSSLLSQSKSLLDSKDKLAGEMKAQTETLQTQVNAAQNAVAEANRGKADEVQKLTQNNNELQQKLDAQSKSLENTIAALRDEVRRNQEQMDSLKETHSQQILSMKKDINQLRGHNEVIANKLSLVNPPDQPDGRVIQSSQAASRAWINLGRRDMLPRGTVFRITDPNTGELKAHGRVAQVESDRSELELYDVRDRFDPVVQGDLVQNDLYSPNLRRTIYLMGRFNEPYNKPMVKSILEDLGNQVVDQIGPNVDLVIVGGDTLNAEGDGLTPITETDEYKQAQYLNIEMAPVNKIRDFLHLSE